MCFDREVLEVLEICKLEICKTSGKKKTYDRCIGVVLSIEVNNRLNRQQKSVYLWS